MNPVLDSFFPYTLDRLASIRSNRECVLASGGVVFVKRPKATSAPKKKKPPVLTPEAEAALAGASPEMRAFLLKALNL